MKMFPQLGRALTLAFRRATSVLDSFSRNLILGNRAAASVIAATHLDGRRVARSTHGVLLPTRVTLTAAEAVAWRREGVRYAERSLELAAPVLGGGVSKFQAQSYARTVLTQSIWNGQDVEALRIAETTEAIWKEWVRAFSREEHRDHHDDLIGRVIPTNELFVLPGGPNAGASVFGPRDWNGVSDAGEWIECGHALRFSREARVRNAA